MATERLPEGLVIAAYGDDVPCVFQLVTDCDAKAGFKVKMTHEDGSSVCGTPEWVPMCPGHARLTQQAMTGFWADLMPPPPCDGCKGKVVLVDVVPL